MDQEIGQVLRAEREARGIELAEVEQATKIRLRYLAAIEDGDWEVLPGRAYAQGFLRTYAGFLGIDPAPLTEELRQQLEPAAAEEAPPDPVVQPGTLTIGGRRRALARTFLALVAIAAIGFAAFAIADRDGDPEEAISPSPPATPVEEEPPEEEPTEPPAPEPEHVSLELEATGTVWVCLVDGRERALVEGEILSAGEDRGPFEARRLLMTFGNGQVELAADGDPLDVPDSTDPIGFEVTPEGLSELDEAERPTCA